MTMEEGVGHLDSILEELKANPVSIKDLKANSPLSDTGFHATIAFLQRLDFIDVKGDKISIMPAGAKFLEL